MPSLCMNFNTTIPLLIQVDEVTVYLTNDSNGAVFPDDAGNFSNLRLASHYEVHGEPLRPAVPAPPQATATTTSNQFAFATQGASSGYRRPATKTLAR